jgi:hypothetical protein
MLCLAAATYVHATIGGTVRTEQAKIDWLLVASVLASISVALFTWRLATATKALAEETVDSLHAARDAIKAEDRRHQDTFMPHIMLRFDYGGQLTAENIGPGLASNLKFEYDGKMQGEIGFRPALRAGDSFVLPNTEDMNASTVTVTATYDDTFGNAFKSDLTVVTGQPSLAQSYSFECVKRVKP